MGYSHEEIIWRWRTGKLTSNTATNIMVAGNKLFSYGHHYPLALKVPGMKNDKGDDFVIVNADKYRVSTSRHSRLVQTATKHFGCTVGLSAFPFDLFRALETGHARIVAHEADRWHYNYGGGGAALPSHCTPADGWEIRYDKDKIWKSAHRPGGVLVRLVKPCRLRENGGDAKTGYYLSGMDEGSYFCCLLPASARPKTMREAFDALTPIPVIQARVGGLTVHRQGEWYFVEELEPIFTKELEKIPLDNKFRRRRAQSDATINLNTLVDSKLTFEDLPHDFRALDFTWLMPAGVRIGNLHVVREIRACGSSVYCRGRVEHRRVARWQNSSVSSGEHKSVMLTKWHRVYRNTARAAWSSNGQVD